MSKRIIVLSDGTGNSAAKVWRTNVWRIFEALDLNNSNVNIILGIIGAGFASWLFAKLGVQIGGPVWVNYLVSGFVGACILILATRIFYPTRWRT